MKENHFSAGRPKGKNATPLIVIAKGIVCYFVHMVSGEWVKRELLILSQFFLIPRTISNFTGLYFTYFNLSWHIYTSIWSLLNIFKENFSLKISTSVTNISPGMY
jgi:hypothetical protein